MYENWYNLKDKPFQTRTDPKFLWLGPKHQQALAAFKSSVMASKGILLLTGDRGTGKTTLAKAFVQNLDAAVQCAVMPGPLLGKMDFFNFLAQAFNLRHEFRTKGAFLEVFGDFLHQSHKEGKRVLLVIDQAQDLQPELLVEIRMLSNLEKQGARLISTFFIGQDDLEQTLPDKAAIDPKQHISCSYHLEPLTLAETAHYIDHRLSAAGKSEPIFEQGAVREIFEFAQGYPRLTNIICDQLLMTGFVKEMRTIGAEAVKECTVELIMAFPSDSDGIELIPIDQPEPDQPVETRNQATDLKKMEGELPQRPAILQEPPSKPPASSVKNIRIVYSRGKHTPTESTTAAAPLESRERDASRFQNADQALQVLKDLGAVKGQIFREALDQLNLARSSPIRMGLNRIYRNITSMEDTIDEINLTVEQIVIRGAMPKLRDLKNNGPAPFLVNLLDILWHETARRYMNRRTREAASKLRAAETFHITDFPQIILGE